MTKCPELGGQAVIEGVMMRGKRNYVVAVRDPKNKIIIKKEKIKPPKKEIWKKPFFRGMRALVEALSIGFKALEWSSSKALGEEEQLSKKETAVTVVFAVLFSILLFIALPFWLTKITTGNGGFLFNLIDGLFRILILVVYILVIAQFKDIKRVFQYHGAEHKTVNCHESGEKLTINNVKKYSTIHARCGTSFLMIVMVVSIIVFSLIVTKNVLIRLLSRIILIPVIAGISYEMLKLSAKYQSNPFIKALISPGLFLQRITTAEPDTKQIQVAIKAMQELILIGF